MNDELTVVDFEVPSERYAETVHHTNPPVEGDTVEVGAKFLDGERLDSGTAEWSEWNGAEYRTVLRGVAADVTRHYHRAHTREELQATVTVEFREPDHGYDPDGGIDR